MMLYRRISQNTQWATPFNSIFKNSRNECERIIYKLSFSTLDNINDKIKNEVKDVEHEKREDGFPNFDKNNNILDPISKTEQNKINKIIKNIKIHVEKYDNLKNEDYGNDMLTSQIYKKIVQEHKLYKKNKDSDAKKKIKNNFPFDKKSKERREDNVVNSQNGENDYFESQTNFKKNIDNDEIAMEQKDDKNIFNEQKIHTQKNTSLMVGEKMSSLSTSQKEHKNNNSKSRAIVEYTKDKNINNILLYNKKKNNLTIHEKRSDHFFKIFFSSKKVKIIKSQNHPIFIHLYKLATNQKYREEQEKILLTNKKIIMERQQNHITRIYTNSIDNLKDFISYDNFILLSNKLLKKLAFLYSFKNGVLAEVMHKFYYDDVGLPHLALCFYNINCTGHKKKNTHNHLFTNCQTEQGDKIEDDTHAQCHEIMTNNLINDKPSKDSHLHLDKNSCYDDIEYLCNGDIGTIIRSCFLLKWQCIFNINDIKIASNKKKKKIENEKINEITDNEIKKCLSDKYSNMYNIYNIDFFHPFTIRASSGYLLDIPYKNTNLYELHKYAKQRKILLLKYNSQSDLYINYKKKNSEQDITFLNLISKAKGVFLIMDNCNNIEKMYTSSVSKTGINISRSYFEETEINGEPFKGNSQNNTTDNNDDTIFDNIYYVNLLNNNNVDKPLELISAYTIFMYILKTNFFKHVPQSSYVCMQ
ncbi:conserved protein, unknown function [Plasmodium chabaudi chabaudi]|uniref:Uncharacterized protein n=1 Tax=Plasmodium chabaudi chabaudi TaxID=31271 RepID=A0A4V0K4F7_PLACU|nr:conserved protein, unknown function [Plasmodium chabaudi chabaudi]VTZ67471.1 conserved protein, unknown function [Plasmodium chabaudi chabaudi]|eukprot:XP_016655201.1 conserved Plasmodium protein, unknown function [Plasmodium chabaudi chabaudi]